MKRIKKNIKPEELDNMTCLFVRVEEISINLTSKEVAVAEHEFANNCLELDSKEAKKKEFIDAWKEDVQPLKDKVSTYLTMLETRTRIERIKKYGVQDVEREQIHVYNGETGELIESRPMSADEQLFI